MSLSVPRSAFNPVDLQVRSTSPCRERAQPALWMGSSLGLPHTLLGWKDPCPYIWETWLPMAPPCWLRGVSGQLAWALVTKRRSQMIHTGKKMCQLHKLVSGDPIPHVLRKDPKPVVCKRAPCLGVCRSVCWAQGGQARTSPQAWRVFTSPHRPGH